MSGSRGLPPSSRMAVVVANVLADGTIETNLASDNVGNANILHPAAGLYCFTGFAFRVNSAVVSGDGDDLRGGCPGGQTSIRVRTLDANGRRAITTAPMRRRWWIIVS